VPVEAAATPDAQPAERQAFPILSVVCAIALVLLEGTQVVVFARAVNEGTAPPIFGPVSSGLAGATTCAALFARSPLWRARITGAGLGAWASIGFVPTFLLGSIWAGFLWATLVLIGASIAAGRLERRLPSGRTLVTQLATGALLAVIALVAAYVALVVIQLVTTPITL
jgi:hypothetical protein